MLILNRQNLHRNYGQEFGCVKIIPPANWKPSFKPWKRENLRFKAKIQSIGLLNGENRQEIAYSSKIRLQKYVSGTPLARAPAYVHLQSGRRIQFKLRKLHVLLDALGINLDEYVNASQLMFDEGTRATIMGAIYECLGDEVRVSNIDEENSIFTQIVTLLNEWSLSDKEQVPLTSFNHLSNIPAPTYSPIRPPYEHVFWTYTPREDRFYRTRILSDVKPPCGSRPLPYVDILVEDPDTGKSCKSRMDEEDIDMYIANGHSRDSARLATKCLLCEICLQVCGFPVDPEDLVIDNTTTLPSASIDDLKNLQNLNPSLICSGCAITVHAKCMQAESFSDKAILSYMATNNCDWFCSACLDHNPLAGKHALSFGYQYTNTEMTRKEYEKISDHKRADFGLCKSSRVEQLESKFWSLCRSSPRDDGKDDTVLYASDLDSGEFSEGPFCDEFGKIIPGSTVWDLRNLSLHADSVLCHLPGSERINGVSRPWLYLGSLFSSFCWHSEDQFLCSTSYLHEGATKVWYTVPGQYRSRMDECMAQLFPDLVKENEDLSHHLVTLVDPEIMISVFGIPVGRVEHNPGEFIITFPQAYHCGFNCGPNLAEAVNVACPDWLDHGRASVVHYSKMKRPSVLCFDQLVWELSTAIISGNERRKDVALFVNGYLFQVEERLKRYIGKMHADESNIVTTCTECKQFCFFSCVNGNRCIDCAEYAEGGVAMKIDLELILERMAQVLTKIGQYRDIRRSTRVTNPMDSKRVRI